jgi:hypothetical protein
MNERNQNRPGDCAHGRTGHCTICETDGYPRSTQPLIIDPWRWPHLAQLRFTARTYAIGGDR